MKIFKFNPETGRRGEQIGNRRRIEWTDTSIEYAVANGSIEPISFVMPRGSKNQEVIAHVDAGYGKESYLTDEWICFCSGEYREGEDNTFWSWTILPPKAAVVRI